MTSPARLTSSRREFLQNTGRVAAATAIAGMIVPQVHAEESNTVQIALIGCGGRGTGAAADAMSVQNGPVKVVAMADVFKQKLDNSHGALKQFGDKFDVPDERKFIGFDGYQKAMDCLKPGDVAIFTTPVAFRWVHFKYAIEKNLNVFMEKPVTTDGPTSKRMLGLAEESRQKNLKVGVGLMCRHCNARQELYDRIQNGELGDLTLLRAYRMSGPVGSCFSGPKPKEQPSELLYQIERFHSFLWASGGSYSDFLIHNIDECCWMKNAWPVKAQAVGGRHFRGNNVDQNFDSYGVEYTFADGAKLLLDGRNIGGCNDEFASYAHGTKNSAVISTSGHTPAKCRIYKGQNLNNRDDLVWSFSKQELNPYRTEWEDLIAAIRSDKPYNEVERGVQASLVTSMGRMAAHTGQVITFDDMLNCAHEFAPDVDKLTLESDAPLQANAEGRYPVPQPGFNTKREYA